MSTYANQITEGGGKFRYRLVAEGWPHIFVSDASLVRTLADGRQQVNGLIPSSIRIAARADLWRASLREQEMTVEIVDDDDGTITLSLHRVPTATTWLTAAVTKSATTINVADTAAFAASGMIHLGNEAIAYTGKTGTSFTGCTRGRWGTTPRAHIIETDERELYPKVTNLPISLRDRRVWLYMYGAATAETSGDGTERWRGVARTDVDHEGLTWRFSIEPRSRILEQTIGGDIEEPVPIRGIYLPSSSGMRFTLDRYTVAAAHYNDYSSIDATDQALIEQDGFWADNAAIAVSTDALLTAATAGWTWDSAGGASIRAEPISSTRWRIVYRTGTTTAHFVRIGTSPIEPGSAVRGLSRVDICDGLWRDSGGAIAETMGLGAVYTMEIEAPTPRAVYGEMGGPWSDFWVDGAGYPSDRIYLGGLVTPTVDMMMVVRPDGEAGDAEVMTQIGSVNLTDRWVRLGPSAALVAGTGARLGPQSRVRLLRVFARGHIGDLIDALIADSPDLAASGATPLLTSDDFASDWTELEQAITDRTLASDRVYIVSQGVSLGEVLEEHLKLSGCYLALGPTGQMKIKRLQLEMFTALTVATLDSGTVKGGLPSTTRSPEGLLSEVLIRTGYDPEEGEHRGLTIRVRNTTGPTIASGGGVLTIAPQSIRSVPGRPWLDMVDIQPSDAFELASTLLGMFGEGYDLITLQAGLERFDLELGDAVLLTSRWVPAADGTMGLTQRPVQIVGYDWSPEEGIGTFTCMVHGRRIAGYAPAFPVASQVQVQGNTWDLTVTTTGYTTGDAQDWFAAGDEVRVIQRNVTSPTRLSGTVSTVSSGTVIRVLFDGAWTPGASEWRLGYDRAPSVDETAPGSRRWAQSAFAFVGGTDRRVGFAGGDVDAWEFTP